MQLTEKINSINAILKRGIAVEITTRLDGHTISKIKDAQLLNVDYETEAERFPADRNEADEEIDLHIFHLCTETESITPEARGRKQDLIKVYNIVAIGYTNNIKAMEYVSQQLQQIDEVTVIKEEFTPDTINSKYLKLEKQPNVFNRYLWAITYRVKISTICNIISL